MNKKVNRPKKVVRPKKKTPVKHKRKNKRQRGSRKGTPYEREVCKLLSRWWSGDERDDIFWRTSQSGGRATSRRRVGKGTHGQYGDVGATDPIGAVLTETVVIEVKRGYNSRTIQDLMDVLPGAKKGQYLKWFEKAEEDRDAAGAYSWMLIVKRDRREDLILVPFGLLVELGEHLSVVNRMKTYVSVFTPGHHVMMLILKDFLRCVHPKEFKGLAKWYTKNKSEKA